MTGPGAPVGEPASFDALLAAAGLPRLEARALLEHASGRTREWLVGHGDEPAPADVVGRFRVLARRRAAGEPLAYLVGGREFFGRWFETTPAVLIPRPDTELLVEAALARAAQRARVLDLGTGSGAIALTLALERPDLAVTATDASPRAAEVAARNAARLGAARVRILVGDWYGALGAGERFEMIVSNPPYIAAGDAHLAAGDLRHEPAQALTDGADGLSALRAIIAAAPQHLAPGGWLLLEHGLDQGDAVRGLLAAAGFGAPATLRDAESRDRVSLGRLG